MRTPLPQSQALEADGRASAQSGASAVEELRKQKLADAGLAEDFLREPLSSEFVSRVVEHTKHESPAVCAIVGGLVASEVIKILSGKEAPINNVLFYDGMTPFGMRTQSDGWSSSAI